MANHKDPGWRPSLQGLRWYPIPIVGEVINIRAWRKERNGLIVLRSVFLGLLVTLFLFLVPLSFGAPWDGGDEGWVPWIVILIGIASLAQVARIRRRPLSTTSPDAFARYYRGIVLHRGLCRGGTSPVGVRWRVPGGQPLDLSRRPRLQSRRAVDDRPDTKGH